MRRAEKYPPGVIFERVCLSRPRIVNKFIKFFRNKLRKLQGIYVETFVT